MSDGLDITLGADATALSTAVAQVKKALNDSQLAAKEQRRQAEISLTIHRRLAEMNERQTRQSRERLSAEERMVQIKERQLRIEQRLSTTSNARQQAALTLARARAAETMRGIESELTGSQSGLIRNVLDAAGLGAITGRYDQAKSMLGGLFKSGAARASLAGAGVLGVGAGAGYLGYKSYGALSNQSRDIAASSRRTGLSLEQSQGLDYAAGMFGNREQVFNVMDDLKVNIGQAIQGS